MGNYRLAPAAKADLERIWLYGLEHWGLGAADEYYAAFFEHFEKLAEQPHLYPTTNIREGYRRSLCGSDSVYYGIGKLKIRNEQFRATRFKQLPVLCQILNSSRHRQLI